MQVLPRLCAKDALGRVRASAPASKLSTVANFITELFIAVSFFFILVRPQGECISPGVDGPDCLLAELRDDFRSEESCCI